jgi:hypothetical protein
MSSAGRFISVREASDLERQCSKAFPKRHADCVSARPRYAARWSKPFSTLTGTISCRCRLPKTLRTTFGRTSGVATSYATVSNVSEQVPQRQLPPLRVGSHRPGRHTRQCRYRWHTRWAHHYRLYVLPGFEICPVSCPGASWPMINTTRSRLRLVCRRYQHA